MKNQTLPIVEERQIQSPTDTVSVIMSLEDMIKTNIASIDKLTSELREKRHMFTDAFQNDPTYKEHEEKAKEATNIKNATKQQIRKQPAIMQMSEKIKSMTADLKEKKSGLSDYLLEYQRLTQATQLELFDGTMVEFVNSSKAVKRSGKK